MNFSAFKSVSKKQTSHDQVGLNDNCTDFLVVANDLLRSAVNHVMSTCIVGLLSAWIQIIKSDIRAPFQSTNKVYLFWLVWHLELLHTKYNKHSLQQTMQCHNCLWTDLTYTLHIHFIDLCIVDTDSELAWTWNLWTWTQWIRLWLNYWIYLNSFQNL